MHTCPWCATHYLNWQNQCERCGGRMPPLPGMELGEPPPPVPRVIPSKYEFRVKWAHNLPALVGAIFFAIGTLIFLPLIVSLPVAALLPLLFMVGGFFMFRHGRKKAAASLKAFRYGTAVAGKIAGLDIDTSQSINGRHPWRLVYHFPVDGQTHEGIITSFDSTVASRSSGQPLWVVYVAEDPTQNAVYPPLV